VIALRNVVDETLSGIQNRKFEDRRMPCAENFARRMRLGCESVDADSLVFDRFRGSTRAPQAHLCKIIFDRCYAVHNIARAEKTSCTRGEFVRVRLSSRRHADATNAYFIDVFVIRAKCARNAVDRWRVMIVRML